MTAERKKQLKVTAEGVEAVLKLRPDLRHRSRQYDLAALMAGCTEEQAYIVNGVIRRMKDVVPVTEIGKQLERETRAEMGMASIHELAEKSLVFASQREVMVNGQLFRVK